jgi:hypothetical protein
MVPEPNWKAISHPLYLPSGGGGGGGVGGGVCIP